MKTKETKTGAAAVRREATRRLEQLRRVEGSLAACGRRRERLDAATERNRARAEALREEIARLVDLAGGALQLPGLPRALHFQTARALEYDPPRVLRWLRAHAPCYTVTETRVDRARLRGALRIRDGEVWLPGADGPVAGVRVCMVRNLVVPKAE